MVNISLVNIFSSQVLKSKVCPSTILGPVKTLFYWPLVWKAKAILWPLRWNSPWVLVNSSKTLSENERELASWDGWRAELQRVFLPVPQLAGVATVKAHPRCLLHRVREEEANRKAGASVATQIMSRGHLPHLGFSQYSLDRSGRVESREHLRILNQREGIFVTVKIFEQSIQTPCGSYWRQAAREQLLRMGNEDMAKTRRQFTVIFFLSFFLSWAAKIALIYSGTYW